MPQEDFGLAVSDDLFVLTDPTTDILERMRNRFRVQFLSEQYGLRGSRFYSAMKAGQIRTNADIVSLFAITAAEIITNMRRLQQDIQPTSVRLITFSFPTLSSIQLTIRINTALGSITDSIEVTA